MAQTIRPTILVGLGGTGKEVLLRVRRKFFDRYGDVQACPNIAYAVFDTDTTDQFLSREVKDSRLFKRIELKGDELVHTALEPQFPLRGRDFEENHPHIARWWIRCIQDVEATRVAGQVRAKGRLAFFQHYGMIRRTLERKRDQVLDPEAFNRTNRNLQFGGQLTFDSKARVYLVGSLAGGSGSGMFLDVCFLMKHIAPEAQRIAFFVLPEVFGDAAKLYANTYAALMELDHYNVPANSYSFRWSPDGREPPADIPGPMLNYCFLVGGRNQADRAAGSGEGGRCTLFEMVAENIFHEFGLSEMADQKQRLRDNIVQYADPERLFPPERLDEARNQVRESGTGTFPCRYFSFGLAALVHPVDRVRRTMAYRLAAETVRRMIDGQAQGPDAQAALIEPLLRAISDLPARLRPDDGMRRLVGDWEAKARRRLMGDYDAFEQAYPGQAGELATMFEPRGALAEAMTKRVEEVRGQLERALRGGIQELVSARFAGVHRVREALVTLRQRALGDATSRANTLAEEWTRKADEIEGVKEGEASPAAAIKEELDEVLGWGVRPLAGLFLKRSAFEIKARELIDEHRLGALRRLEAMGYRAAVRLAEEVLDELASTRSEIDPATQQARLVYDGEARRLAESADGLTALHAYLDEMYKAFRRPVESSLILNLYDEATFDDVYYKPYTEKLSREDLGLKVLAEGARAGLFGEPSVLDLARRCEGNKEEDVGDWVAQVLMAYFADIHDRYDALKLIYDRYPLSRVDQEIANLYQGSQVWLQASQVAARAAFSLAAGQVQRLAARPQGSSHAAALERSIKNAAGAIPPALFSISDRNAAAFYQEIGGFPLFYARAVEEYRPKYLSLIRHQQASPEFSVHLFEGYHVLADIYYPTDEERERLRQARRALLLGSLMGVLQVLAPRQGMSEPRFQYMIRRSGRVPEPWVMGERFVALRELSAPTADDRRRLILDDVATALAGETPGEFRADLYLVVSTLLLSKRFSRWRDEVGGNRRRYVTLEYQFLEELMADMESGFAALADAQKEEITAQLERLGPEPSREDLERFLAQFAQSHNGEWQMKGTGTGRPGTVQASPGRAAS